MDVQIRDSAAFGFDAGYVVLIAACIKVLPAGA